MDGSGYPGGIKGTEIILEARIIAISDVISSMTADRPWRKALPIEAALDEIRSGRGTRYDASVTDAAIELFTKQSYRLDPEYYGRKR
jgi:HD-GYP domain-containing protein (c-di-GMP phosphodiesterase class II)